MSNAKPMGDHRRATNYVIQGRNGFTPRQWRRWRHKHNSAEGYFGHWAEGTKKRPTPRRADARAAMLERRRG